MEEIDMVRLSVPGDLRYRNVVLSAVAAACRVLRPAPRQKQDPSLHARPADFEEQVLSAVGEAFNNVAIHAYRGGSAGAVELEVEGEQDGLTIRIRDHGAGYDPTQHEHPNLDELPESNMGLFIMRSCMDTVSYCRGNPPQVPNVLTLFKRFRNS
jgi:serine/threonine-protein kinase RsbW